MADGLHKRVVEREQATVVFLECRGFEAARVADAVVERLASEAGLFIVWIAPGPREDVTRVHIEGPNRKSWALVFDGERGLRREASAEPVTAQASLTAPGRSHSASG